MRNKYFWRVIVVISFLITVTSLNCQDYDINEGSHAIGPDLINWRFLPKVVIDFPIEKQYFAGDVVDITLEIYPLEGTGFDWPPELDAWQYERKYEIYVRIVGVTGKENDDYLQNIEYIDRPDSVFVVSEDTSKQTVTYRIRVKEDVTNLDVGCSFYQVIPPDSKAAQETAELEIDDFLRYRRYMRNWGISSKYYKIEKPVEKTPKSTNPPIIPELRIEKRSETDIHEKLDRPDNWDSDGFVPDNKYNCLTIF
ncbi:MAG: hypothetical protein PHR06_15315 [Candidatus Cloacimonetes bacterium]|nr:hypothetical protein [Candidatus Cloacimonadota bacterium]